MEVTKCFRISSMYIYFVLRIICNISVDDIVSILWYKVTSEGDLMINRKISANDESHFVVRKHEYESFPLFPRHWFQKTENSYPINAPSLTIKLINVFDTFRAGIRNKNKAY